MAKRRAETLFHELWANDDEERHAAAQKVLSGRYSWLEEGILDPSGDGPMIPPLADVGIANSHHYHETIMPGEEPSTGGATVPIREHAAARAERWRLDEAAKVVFHNAWPSDDHLIAAASLHRTFPSVPPERLREAADVLVEAMSGAGDEISSERLDSAVIKIADVFSAE